MRRKLIAGNWKLHAGPAEAAALAGDIRTGIEKRDLRGREVAVFPPFVSLQAVRREIEGSPMRMGGQNVHWEETGAYTGEISAPMLAEAGCRYALVGHSERRTLFGEDEATVAKKALACSQAGLSPVVCVGESLEQRDSGRAFDVVRQQLGVVLDALPAESGEFVLAYEPVWAIGTGRVASPSQVAEMHATVREFLGERMGEKRSSQTLILYGGSVKAANAADLIRLDDVDGALVGGASLKAESFLPIVFWDDTLD